MWGHWWLPVTNEGCRWGIVWSVESQVDWQEQCLGQHVDVEIFLQIQIWNNPEFDCRIVTNDKEVMGVVWQTVNTGTFWWQCRASNESNWVPSPFNWFFEDLDRKPVLLGKTPPWQSERCLGRNGILPCSTEQQQCAVISWHSSWWTPPWNQASAGFQHEEAQMKRDWLLQVWWRGPNSKQIGGKAQGWDQGSWSVGKRIQSVQEPQVGSNHWRCPSGQMFYFPHWQWWQCWTWGNCTWWDTIWHILQFWKKSRIMGQLNSLSDELAQHATWNSVGIWASQLNWISFATTHVRANVAFLEWNFVSSHLQLLTQLACMPTQSQFPCSKFLWDQDSINSGQKQKFHLSNHNFPIFVFTIHLSVITSHLPHVTAVWTVLTWNATALEFCKRPHHIVQTKSIRSQSGRFVWLSWIKGQ